MCNVAKSSTFFAGDGDGYEAQMGRWSRRLAPLLIDFTGIAAAARVLDAGCGTGSLAFALAGNPCIGSVQAIDCCPAYVRYARERAESARVEFCLGDACELPFENASFDHSLSSLVLQFIPDGGRAVREMRRVTRPGDMVAATTWDSRGGVIIQRIFFDTAAVLDPVAEKLRARAFSRRMSQPEGLAQTWHQAGLLNVVQGSLTIRMDFLAFDDFWMSIDGKDGPYAEYLSTLGIKAKATLRQKVVAAYLDGDPDGHARMRQRRGLYGARSPSTTAVDRIHCQDFFNLKLNRGTP